MNGDIYRQDFSGYVLCVVAEMRSNGVVPANYLLEGLKEMAFTLGSWTRTKEVSLTANTHRTNSAFISNKYS